jgi:hypothetical protein
MTLRILAALVLVGGTAFGGTWAFIGNSEPAIGISQTAEAATFRVASVSPPEVRTPALDAAYPHLVADAIRPEAAAKQALLSQRLEQLAEARRVQLLGIPQAEAAPVAEAPIRAEAAAKPAIREIPAAARSVKPAVAERKAEDKDSNVLTVAQIQRIKRTLKLTQDQEGYWPPVEAALRNIAKEQAAQKPIPNGKPSKMTVSPDASQKLYWAAAPLIMSLRYDQKHEARRLARSMGLEEVASAI